MVPVGKVNSSPCNDGGVSKLLEENLKDSRKKKRKQSFLLSKDPSDRIVEGVINDDEIEKKKRKEEAKLIEQENAEKARVKAPKPSPFSLLSNLTPAELEEHYSQCIRMCNQNKVNPKNAFKLQLIDYMKLILMKQSKKTENLSLMSCTLDASVKIYSCRVDKVYSDMIKIMSGKVWKGDEETDTTDIDDNPEVEANEVTIAKKKRKTDKEGNVDMEKMLWSESRLDKSEGESEAACCINYGRMPLPSNAEFFLECPISDGDGRLSLNEHLFNQSDTASSSSFLKDFAIRFTGNFETLDPSKIIPGYLQMYGSDNVNVPVNNNLVYDKESHLIPTSIAAEEDVNIADNEDPQYDYDECLSDEDGVEPSPLTTLNSTKIGQLSAPKITSFSVNGMSKLVSMRHSDYSFFDNSRLNFVGGPVHWSIKSHKNKVPKTAEVPKSSKKEGTIDFSLQKKNTMIKIFSDICKLQLSSKTMKTWSRTNYSIPMNIYNQRNIVNLFHNKNLVYMNGDFKNGLYKNEPQSNIDLNESLTPEEFIIGMDGDKDGEGEIYDDVRDDFDHNEDRIPTINEELTGEHPEDGNNLELIPAPPRVNKIAIKYAKAQKRVDIKLLKETIWQYMKLERKKHDNTNEENENQSENQNGVEVKLSDIYKALPERLPEEEASQMSFPLVFMAMLHMANEKTLQLVGTEKHDDVTIKLG